MTFVADAALVAMQFSAKAIGTTMVSMCTLRLSNWSVDGSSKTSVAFKSSIPFEEQARTFPDCD